MQHKVRAFERSASTTDSDLKALLHTRPFAFSSPSQMTDMSSSHGHAAPATFRGSEAVALPFSTIDDCAAAAVSDLFAGGAAAFSRPHLWRPCLYRQSSPVLDLPTGAATMHLPQLSALSNMERRRNIR